MMQIAVLAETAKAMAQEEAETREDEFSLQSRQNSPGRGDHAERRH